MKPKDTTMAAVTTIDNLRSVLEISVLFASKDGPSDAVCSVALAADGDVLTGTATNRYVLGHMRSTASGTLPEVLVPYEHAKLLVNTLGKVSKPARQANADLAIEQRPNGRRLIVSTPSFDISVDLLDEKTTFPDVTKVIGRLTEITSDLTQPILLNPSLLAPFTRAHKLLGTPPARWTFAGPLKPVRVEMGDSFVGVAMPNRQRDDAERIGWPVPFGLPARSEQAAA